jgi:tetraacyldisaccharide 4'-kinase
MKSLLINKFVLFPYYLILKFRHYLYDVGFFKSYKFDIPIISIGNLSVGGTGKTPHTEYIVKELMQFKRVAVLSRGYGRKTRGFRYVEIIDRAKDTGDEPLQIKRKFPEVTVAVDGDRVRGIGRLMELEEGVRPEVIVLDDAFQHRRVVPSLNILLIDYNLPPGEDNLLPFGKLRDLPSQMGRADVVVVTKCPPGISGEDVFLWKNRLRIEQHQKLCFSAISYGSPEPVFEECDMRYTYSNFAILITGIANPKPLEYHLLDRYKIIKRKRYGDHHAFNSQDAKSINKLTRKYSKAVIFTTEKDSQRLIHLSKLSFETRKRTFLIPIEVTILNQNSEMFSNLLKDCAF